jgi:hypothetical protein
MTMTAKQKELWDIADAEIRVIGVARLNRDPQMRAAAKIEGSKIWALNEALGAARGMMPDDDECQKLIDAIREG